MFNLEECANFIKEHEEEILNDWKCVQCGWCCLMTSGGPHLNYEDYERWERVKVKSNIGTYYILDLTDTLTGDFLNPKTNDEFYRCPFLRKIPKKNKYECKIHASEIKPEYCKSYFPGIQIHCKGFRQVVKRKLGLKFKKWLQEQSFFSKLKHQLFQQFGAKLFETFREWSNHGCPLEKIIETE